MSDEITERLAEVLLGAWDDADAREAAAALRPTVDALLAEARREGLSEAADRVQKIYDLQCPPLSADTYIDRGAWMAHSWWSNVLGAELRRIREVTA